MSTTLLPGTPHTILIMLDLLILRGIWVLWVLCRTWATCCCIFFPLCKICTPYKIAHMRIKSALYDDSYDEDDRTCLLMQQKGGVFVIESTVTEWPHFPSSRSG